MHQGALAPRLAMLDVKVQAGHSPVEVLRAFLKLGLISFGGPAAHIGYFRDEFVLRRRWLDDAAYTELVALCQFLPGPASSQVGFSIGLMRAGYLGGLAAWSGFTLPSAFALVLFAYGAHALVGPLGAGLLHGLKLVAVAIVAHAVFGMTGTLCPDRQRMIIATLALVLVLVGTSSTAQSGVILLGALAGFLFCRSTPAPLPAAPVRTLVSRRVGVFSLSAFVLLLAIASLPVLPRLGAQPGVALFDAFYRSGALVFGGGHVVLPLLRDAFVKTGWVTDSAFLAGYGAAQAVPGPLFTFAAYLGALVAPAPQRLFGAALGLIGIFLPGMLLLLGTLPFWNILRSRAAAQAAMRGINAAVVGVLGAALYNPLWTSSVSSTADIGVALTLFLLLIAFRVRALWVVVLGALAGVALALIRIS
jgi:chromate transporter